MKFLAIWFMLFVGAMSSSHAEEPSEAPATEAAEAPQDAFSKAWAIALDNAKPKPLKDVFHKFDDQFGKFVVGPLAAVMFFDIVAWDNTLEKGAGIGAIDSGEGFVRVVTTYEAGQGYGRQRGWIVDAVEPMIPRGTSAQYGGTTVNIVRTPRAGKLMIMAQIERQPADLEALGLTPWGPEEGGSPLAMAKIPGLSFPVSVNRQTSMFEPTEGLAPKEWGEIKPGATVVVPSQGGAERVIAGGKPGAWQVLAPEIEFDDTALANPENIKVPIVVAWLVFGAVFFTLRMMFINLRGVGHAVLVTMGRYDDPDHEGEISHFQALSSALSATVGLGNISGVAIAIGIGGPGAVFWMWVAGFLGMSSKFTECTLGQMYRVTKPDGTVSGGPMHYLDKGLAEMGLGPLGKVLSILFALMCIGGSFGGGNMFQANQSFEAVSRVVPGISDYAWLYGLMLMVLVGIVIIGGIKRIGAAASIVVPVMCGIYMLAGLYILVLHASELPQAFGAIVGQAFSPEAGMGGLFGVLAIGFQRASFSNEAGVGSASIAHSAAATDEPVREGIVALLEPFIDTILVCSVTALVVVLTGVKVPSGQGIGPTMDAFGSVLPWFPYVLAFAAMMFAFSTMVSWSYYGESCATFLFGDGARLPYRVLFLAFVFIGSVLELGNVLTFSDLMILGMAFPNILGALLLSGKVKAALDAYMADLKSGKFEVGT